MADDLFSSAAEDALSANAPLAARLRPRTLDDIVGQEQLLGAGQPLRTLVEADRLSSVILWGPPGTGKTTLAQAIAAHTSKAFEQLSAVSAGVKDVRDVLERARHRLGERGQGTILFLDEVHRFNKSQQDALLPGVESGPRHPHRGDHREPVLRGQPAAAQPLDAVPAPRPRPATPPGRSSSGACAPRAPPPTTTPLEHLAGHANGDGRHVLTSLEVAVAIARARATPPVVTLADAEAALGTKALRYGRDEHYDVISAFIKSIRGSDPDAGLYWLARMLEAGEDARFIVRRLIILASEDVGEADPQALSVAVAAAHAVEHVGLPEAQLNLAQAVVHLATAPKSNRAALGIWQRAGGRPPRPVGGGARPPPRRALPGRPEARARGGLRLSSRPPRGVGAAALPPRRARGPHLLRPLVPRLRAGDPHAHGTQPAVTER